MISKSGGSRIIEKFTVFFHQPPRIQGSNFNGTQRGGEMMLGPVHQGQGIPFFHDHAKSGTDTALLVSHTYTTIIGGIGIAVRRI